MTRGRAAAPHERGPRPERNDTIATLEEAATTPVMREYRAVVERYPDAIVLARMGDFYEMFGPDAEAAATILGVTLTARGFGSAGRLPMCGVPHHSASGYIRRLLDAGRSVVLWDQVGEVIPGKPVLREVSRVLSPGTVIEAEYLDEGRTARCVALWRHADVVVFAALDAAAGDMQVGAIDGGWNDAALAEELARLDVAEILVEDSNEPPLDLLPGVPRRRLARSLFDPARGRERVSTLLGDAANDVVEGMPGAVIGAVGALLSHCERARLELAPHHLTIRPRGITGVMRLDRQTMRNLEIVVPLGESGLSLAGLLDATRTPMGARLLRRRLVEPLTAAPLIDARLDSVEWLHAQTRTRDVIREGLREVRDLERLVTRCIQGIATPRDLVAIRRSLRTLPILWGELAGARGVELADARRALEVPGDLAGHLEAMLADDVPAHAREGGSIRPGADAELDRLLGDGADAREFIASLEERERERTAIRSLKVGYNRVFGYYIEISHAHGGDVPADYVRKQTLAGAERYITPQLKEKEAIVLGARDRAVEREIELVRDCTRRVAEMSAVLLAAARAVAVLDVTQSLAEVAAQHRWVRPAVDSSTVIDIERGRHPLVEAALPGHAFVANDCVLDAAERIVIITGPNMAGKSTFLRQVAIITLLAQVGAFVPAQRARIGTCDRIFTRVGAHDDLAAGRSTFMVEMAETAAILRQATARSLVILDEIGRGTSTYDGLSIARAVVEHMHDAPHLNCRTLFATHYHELTGLADSLPRVHNARVEVVEEGDSVAFLHRIVAGGADRSYGIHVAKLAGLPASVVTRARHLLTEMEAERPLRGPGTGGGGQLDLGLAAPPAHPVVDELTQLDIDELTPLDALNKLAELRARVR